MFYSVRARLTLWYTAVLAVVLVTFSGISYVVLAREIRASTDALLGGTARELTGAFIDAPARAASSGELLLDFRYSDRAIMVFSTDGQIVASSRSSLSREDRTRVANLVRSGFTGYSTVAGGAEDDGIRVFANPIDVVGIRHIVVVARELHDQIERLESAQRALFLGIPLALLFAAGGGYVLARKSLAPVTTMSVKARQIGAETLTERITVENERDANVRGCRSGHRKGRAARGRRSAAVRCAVAAGPVGDHRRRGRLAAPWRRLLDGVPCAEVGDVRTAEGSIDLAAAEQQVLLAGPGQRQRFPAAQVDPQVDGAPGRLADGWVGLAVRQLQARRIDRPG